MNSAKKGFTILSENAEAEQTEGTTAAEVVEPTTKAKPKAIPRAKILNSEFAEQAAAVFALTNTKDGAVRRFPKEPMDKLVNVKMERSMHKALRQIALDHDITMMDFCYNAIANAVDALNKSKK